MNDLDSPADGRNIIRDPLSRGYSDGDIKNITGDNALSFFRRVMT